MPMNGRFVNLDNMLFISNNGDGDISDLIIKWNREMININIVNLQNRRLLFFSI
jgi:hypothetical protein